MANYVVFLDHEHAKIFELHPENVVEATLKKHEIKHHTSHDKDHTRHSEKFFHEVAGKLLNAHEVLLVGPGIAKEHFMSHLKEHHHEQIAKKVVGIETVDHPTDGQIVAMAKKFFKAHLKFE